MWIPQSSTEYKIKEYKPNPSAETLANFKQYRNLYVDKIRKCQRYFNKNLYQKLETPKERWKFINVERNKLLNNITIPSLKYADSKTYETDTVNAEHVNDIFLNLGRFDGTDSLINQRGFPDFQS